MENKICNKCGITKNNCDFNKNKNTKDGLTSYCTNCLNNYKKEYYLKNCEKEKEKFRIYCKNNPDKVKETHKKYYETNSDKSREYYLKNYNPIIAKIKNKEYRDLNKNKEKERKRKYIEANRDKINNYAKEYRKLNNHKFAYRYVLINTLRRLGKIKEGHTIDLLGYSALDLKNHITNLFTDGMSWDNYGEWHIDHIITVFSFDPNTSMNIVNALSNLRPLWATTREINGIVYIGNLNRPKK